MKPGSRGSAKGREGRDPNESLHSGIIVNHRRSVM